MFVFLLIVFMFGLIIGSFTNVCIYRIPRDLSIVKPRSSCPACGTLIRWYENIPVLSYVFLRGKCHSCGSRISLQYPLIELLTGVAFVLVAIRYPFQPLLVLYLAFTFVLIAISGIDYFTQIIPDVFSYSLVILGLLFSCINGSLGTSIVERILNSFFGVLLGGGILWGIGFAAEKAIGQEAMGGGDIKLLAGVGAILGWQKVLSTLFFGSLFASFLGLTLIAMKRMKKREYIPFGPFLAFASYMNMFMPDPWQLLQSITLPFF
jgi:leader peptidase (prepilin peptidase)/N-methyltransferase